MTQKKVPFLRGRLNSFGYAMKGIAAAFRSERNLQWHGVSAAAVVGLGLYLNLSKLEWGVITTAIGLVWMAELFNTALEVLVNLVSPEYHPLAGKAKDIAAGAVLIASLTAALLGLLVFWPYLPRLLEILQIPR